MVSIMVTIRSLLNIIKSQNENIKLTPGEFSRRPAMQGGGVIFETPSPIQLCGIMSFNSEGVESCFRTFL